MKSDWPRKELSIVEFTTDPQLLNVRNLSLAQRTCLKSIYGLPLDDDELEVYRRATARMDDKPLEQHEATVIAGRRSGKTSRIAAPIACFEAFRGHRLARGERAYVVIIAPVLAQAKIAFRYVRHYLLDSPILRKKVLDVRRDEIDLQNGITIAVYACSYISVRGFSVVTAICDELAFWRHEETAANPEEEVIAALRPAMATFPLSKLIKISTPYAKEGILWREFRQRAELDFPVWQLSSAEMNPTLREDILEKARRRNEEEYRREFLGEFTDSVTGWVTPEILEPCVVQGRTEVPPISDVFYAAAIDPGFRRSDFALAILHRMADHAIVVDRVCSWTGTKQAPLGFAWVCERVRSILRQWRLDSVVGDAYCSPAVRQELLRLGTNYEEFQFGSRTRAELFGNLKHLLIQRRIQLLDHPELLRQLRSLEEIKGPGGQIDIRPAYGQKDDLAIAVAIGAFRLCQLPEPWAGFYLGKESRESETFRYLPADPETCPRGSVCLKSPRCMDDHDCQFIPDKGFNL
jgi:hypothetical protein